MLDKSNVYVRISYFLSMMSLCLEENNSHIKLYVIQEENVVGSLASH